jgi:hypothetical protein
MEKSIENAYQPQTMEKFLEKDYDEHIMHCYENARDFPNTQKNKKILKFIQISQR